MTWTAAWTYCQQIGGTLAQVHTTSEANKIVARLAVGPGPWTQPNPKGVSNLAHIEISQLSGPIRHNDYTQRAIVDRSKTHNRLVTGWTRHKRKLHILLRYSFKPKSEHGGG